MSQPNPPLSCSPNFSELFSSPLQFAYNNWPCEKAVIVGAPMTLIVIIILVILGTWLVFRFLHKRELGQIPLLERQLTAKEDDLARRDKEIIQLTERIRQLKHQHDTIEIARDHQQKLGQEQEGKARAIPTLAAQQQLVSTLKKYGEDPANVTVLFAERKHRPLADTLIAAFNLAGWQTNLMDVPLDSYVTHRPYLSVQGIEVRGYNKHLVEVVTDAFKTAGLSEAQAIVKEPEITRDNPKWNSVQHSIRVIIERTE